VKAEESSEDHSFERARPLYDQQPLNIYLWQPGGAVLMRLSIARDIFARLSGKPCKADRTVCPICSLIARSPGADRPFCDQRALSSITSVSRTAPIRLKSTVGGAERTISSFAGGNVALTFRGFGNRHAFAGWLVLRFGHRSRRPTKRPRSGPGRSLAAWTSLAGTTRYQLEAIQTGHRGFPLGWEVECAQSIKSVAMRRYPTLRGAGTNVARS
jgi:hypothetical protein